MSTIEQQIAPRTLYIAEDTLPWFSPTDTARTLCYFTLSKKQAHRHNILTLQPDGMVATSGAFPNRPRRLERASRQSIRTLMDVFVSQYQLSSMDPHAFLLELARHHALADVLESPQAHLYIHALLETERMHAIT